MGKRSSSAGKGDIPRKINISKSEWDYNWELAFGKKGVNNANEQQKQNDSVSS